MPIRKPIYRAIHPTNDVKYFSRILILTLIQPKLLTNSVSPILPELIFAFSQTKGLTIKGVVNGSIADNKNSESWEKNDG